MQRSLHLLSLLALAMGLYDSLIKLLNPQPPRTPLLTLLGGGVDLDTPSRLLRPGR